jgi:glycosyltransferase 2 family protein
MSVPPAPVAAAPDLAPLPDEGNGRPARPQRRGLRIFLVLLGLGVLGALAALVGWGPIADNLARIGPLYFLVLVGLCGAAQIAFTLGWWCIVGRPHPMSFGELLAAYLAGDSVNYFTSVGGEPVKAHLLDSKMGFRPAFATIWVHRNVDVLSQWLFLVVGAVVTMTHFKLPNLVRWLVIAGLVVLGGLAIGFTGLQSKGFFGAFFRILMKVPVLAKKLRHLEEHAHAVDEKIRLYYHREEHKTQFAWGVAWGFIGWCGGLFETWIVLRLLSPTHGFASAYAVEALAMILNSVLLFIPAKIGSAEGIRVAVAAVLGLTPAQGVAYALVRRAREIVWLVPGFVILAKHHLVDVTHLRLQALPAEERLP